MIRDRHDTNADTYADLLGPGNIPAVARVVAALDAACTPAPSPQAARLDAAMARTLHAQLTAPARQHRPGVKMRRRVASVVAAFALALAGLVTYLRWPAPTPVSAQSILRHTVAAFSASDPSQATHDVLAVHTSWTPGTTTGGFTAADLTPDTTYDAWVHRDASGAIAREDIRATDVRGTTLLRAVQDGRTLTVYDAKTGTTQITTPDAAAQPHNALFPDPLDADSLRQFVLAAQQGTDQEAHVLPQQTIDGATVDVVQVTRMQLLDARGTGVPTPHRYTATLYVDAATYILRKLEMEIDNPAGAVVASGVVQDLRHEVVFLSDVPAKVFLSSDVSAKIFLSDVPAQSLSPRMSAHRPAGR